MNYGPGRDRFVTVGALLIRPLVLVKALLAEGTVVTGLSQHAARDLLALGAQLGQSMLNTL